MSGTQRRIAWYRGVVGLRLQEQEDGTVGPYLGDIEENAIEEESPAHTMAIKHDHYFSDLRRYSIKYLKFQQRKSLSAIPGSQGVCLAAALMWIKEKLTTTNSLYRSGRSRNKLFVAPTSEDEIHKSNADIAGLADEYQKLLINGADISPITSKLTLESDPLSLGLCWKNENNIPVVDFPKTLATAADSLPKGKAVCFEILVQRPYMESAGHAVAIYRSRGGTLHFFDPNAGAYKVRNVQQFMEAWVTGCGNRGWSISPYFRGLRNDHDDSWYHVFTRDQ